MKTKFTTFTRFLYPLFTILVLLSLDSCNKIQDPAVSPYQKSGRTGNPQPQAYPVMYDEYDQPTTTPIRLYVVGTDNFDETTNYRLYPTAIACQAYEYLFLRANATGYSELGAYITGRGIVIGPNQRGEASRYDFATWGSSQGTRNPVLYTTGGLITITGMMHTHPGGTSTPTDEDKKNLAARFDIPQYIIANLYIYLFKADGTSTQVATYNDRKCP